MATTYSKATEARMCAAFVTALARTVPHRNATAHLERSGRHGLEIRVRAVGTTTTTRLGPSGCCRVPDGGEWRDVASGELLATAGAARGSS